MDSPTRKDLEFLQETQEKQKKNRKKSFSIDFDCDVNRDDGEQFYY